MRYEELTIEGRNAVLEAFRSGRTIDRLFVLKGCQDGPYKQHSAGSAEAGHGDQLRAQGASGSYERDRETSGSDRLRGGL